MREFKCAPFGDYKVDLDDPKTYKHLPKTTKELDNLMFKQIGYALCYMNNFHPDVFKKNDGGQKKRVKKLIQAFCDNRSSNYENLAWYQEQVFLFQDETENMC